MSEETKTIDPASVAAQILADAPKPSAQPKPETVSEPKTGETGKPKTGIMHNGREYDPEHYRTKPDGSLFLNRHGHPMPKGGRKPKAVSETAPKPETETSAWSDAERAAAAAPLQPETGNGETGNGKTENREPPPEVITPSGTRRAAARAGMRLVYTGTGVVTGNPEEAVPPAKEDRELQDTAAYILDTSGWNPGPIVGFVVLLITYIIFVGSRPKNRQALVDWWKGQRAKNITPAAKPAAKPDAAPAAASASKPVPARAAAPAADANDPYAQYR